MILHLKHMTRYNHEQHSHAIESHHTEHFYTLIIILFLTPNHGKNVQSLSSGHPIVIALLSILLLIQGIPYH